jgi:predicted N-formylglutamate amidohydrolase
VPDTTVLITCEHGGNDVPPEYDAIFRGQRSLLDSHRGWDPGALDAARHMAGALVAPLIANTVSRLLVDCNRSIGNRGLFSTVTRGLSASEKESILERYYRPYRDHVESAVETAVIAKTRVLHLSIHTFTPVMDGVVRATDIGILYDPSRLRETRFSDSLKAYLGVSLPVMRVRRNYPYRGVADGFATHLRKRYDGDVYAGIEIEINQKHDADGGGKIVAIAGAIAAGIRSLKDTL